MNKAALTKHEIYNKLFGFTEHDLDAVANFIDFMRHKKKLEAKKLIKLEGILKGHYVTLLIYSSPTPIPQTNLSLTLQELCFQEYHFQSDIPVYHILLPQGSRP